MKLTFYLFSEYHFNRKLLLHLTRVVSISDKSTLDEAAQSLYGLKKIAANYDCIPSILDGLANYIRIVLTLTDNVDCPAIDKAINELMNQVLQVFVALTPGLIYI